MLPAKWRRTYTLCLVSALGPVLSILGGAAAQAQQPTYPVYSINDCSNPSGRVWYVNASVSGGNYTTNGNGHSLAHPLSDINYAASVTKAGDLVCVLTGTYQPVYISTSGTSGNWIKYEAMAGQTVTINAAGAWSGVYVEASYIQISGFDVVGGNASLSYNTAVSYENDPGDHPDYNGNCISVTPPSSTGPYPTHVKILENVVEDCPGGGIATASADYLTISGNVVLNNSWYSAYGTSGISTFTDYDSNPKDTSSYRVIISDNDVYNNMEFIPWVSAGRITDGEGIVIDSNLNSAYDSSVPYGPYGGRTLVANNVINGNGSAGIEVFESAHVDVMNNSTYGNLVGSTFQNESLSSGEFLIYTASDVRALNNIFYAVGNSAPVFDYDTCPQCYIDYNVYFGGQPNQWPNGVPTSTNDVHSHFLNPNYVSISSNPASVNLQIESPYTDVLNNGTGWLAPTTDITGKTRVVSSSYTVPVGAYTYP